MTPGRPLGWDLEVGRGQKLSFSQHGHVAYLYLMYIIIFDVTLLYLDKDGYKQYPSTTYQQKSY